jgi:hypothetical protein
MKLPLYAYCLCLGMLLWTTSCTLDPHRQTGKSKPEPEPHLAQLQTYGIDHTSWPEHNKAMLSSAVKLSGTPYQSGGRTPESGFDCSGFVRYVYAHTANLKLPHNARAISQIGFAIPKQELQAGDLVFFNTLRYAFSHVGIYLGNNRFIHAPSSGGQVRIEDMQQTYWKNRFDGAKRIYFNAKK